MLISRGGAVPSLYEIWKQEKHRMAKLIPKRHDFLAQSDTTPLTVSNHSKVQSGSQLARNGMEKLVGVTPELSESFRRCMKGHCVPSRIVPGKN